MKILTSQDSDLVSSCCSCQMPSCPEPRKECESLHGTGYVGGWLNDDEPPTWWKTYYGKVRYQFQNSGDNPGHWYEYTVNPMFSVQVGGVTVSTPVQTMTEGGGSGHGHPIEKTYSNPITSQDAAAAIREIIRNAVDWENEDMSKGAECQSSSFEDFSIFVGPNVRAVHARYRFGVPEDFSTPEAPRSTWEMQWDEVFFPKEYDEWAWDVHYYREAVAAHEAWEACESMFPGQCGDEPEIPPDPGPAPVEPTVVANREWTWGGSMDEPWSPWFEIPMPETEGELRTVNIMVKCYKSTHLGVKPTAHGETYHLET